MKLKELVNQIILQEMRNLQEETSTIDLEQLQSIFDSLKSQRFQKAEVRKNDAVAYWTNGTNEFGIMIDFRPESETPYFMISYGKLIVLGDSLADPKAKYQTTSAVSIKSKRNFRKNKEVKTIQDVKKFINANIKWFNEKSGSKLVEV